MAKDHYIWFLRMTPLLSARPMAIIAMAVEYEWCTFIYAKDTEILDSSLVSSFAASMTAMLRETSSISISKPLICLLYCSKRQWLMSSPGTICPIFLLTFWTFLSRLARHRQWKFSSLLSVFFIGSAGEEGSLRLTNIQNWSDAR